jgi:predicted DCC family thiol-disulfide oxidoreductase YuxK
VSNSANGVLVYDGQCGFCVRAAQWIESKWPSSGPTAVSWQRLGATGLERLGLDHGDVERAAWWVSGTRRQPGHLAVARSLIAARGGYGLLGRVLLVPPIRWFAALGYRVVAANRSRLPGGTVCAV